MPQESIYAFSSDHTSEVISFRGYFQNDKCKKIWGNVGALRLEDDDFVVINQTTFDDYAQYLLKTVPNFSYLAPAIRDR